MRIILAAPEAVPLVKIGGLADAAMALAKALARRGHEVELVLPRYRIMPRIQPVWQTQVRFGPTVTPVEFSEAGTHCGVRYRTVGLPADVALSEPGVGPALASSYEPPRQLRPQLVLSRAVAAYATRPDRPVDVLHCHDWQLSHAISYLSRTTTSRPPRRVLTIHNLAYQGRYRAALTGHLGTGYQEQSLLAQAIIDADAITTVSDRYRQETLTSGFGAGLDRLLRQREAVYYGIRNGLDDDEFDPATDPYLPVRYDARGLAGKAADKAQLQRFSGLAEEPQVAVVGFVGRLVLQKGVDLLLSALDGIVQLGAQIVVVGRGSDYEHLFTQVAARSPQVAYHPDSSEPMARLVYAGSDLFLAPSRFEPFGLAPLIALRYGAVPVVHEVGGMAETVGATRLGYTFREYSVAGLQTAVAGALADRRDRTGWAARQRAGMAARFSWDEAAQQYERVYRGSTQTG